MKQARGFLSGPKLLVAAALIGVLAAVATWWLRSGDSFRPVEVTIPQQLSALALEGQALFEANCAECHGQEAGGTDHGPPLIHDFYKAGHHPDAAFFSAVRNGARAHHWPFGNMPAQPQVSESEVEAIVRYVRELQAANGIL